MSDAPVQILDVARRLRARLKPIGAGEYAGPCPICGGKDRFSLNTRKGVFNCRGCGICGDDVELARQVGKMNFADAFEFARARAPDVRLPRNDKFPAPPQSPAPPLIDQSKVAIALDLWRASTMARGTLVERYLATRSLTLDETAAKAVRWNGSIGAMVALFRDVMSGAPQAVSRTFLDRDGRKTERKFLGPVGGAAIMLDGFEDMSNGLHIGEGIETCLAARQLGMRPAWALGSAGALAAFPLLGGVKCLTLLAENDQASEKSVEQCAARWHAAEREVFINRSKIGKDLNDALRGSA